VSNACHFESDEQNVYFKCLSPKSLPELSGPCNGISANSQMQPIKNEVPTFCSHTHRVPRTPTRMFWASGFWDSEILSLISISSVLLATTLGMYLQIVITIEKNLRISESQNLRISESHNLNRKPFGRIQRISESQNLRISEFQNLRISEFRTSESLNLHFILSCRIWIGAARTVYMFIQKVWNYLKLSFGFLINFLFLYFLEPSDFWGWWWHIRILVVGDKVISTPSRNKTTTRSLKIRLIFPQYLDFH
jgi:hypothetical protein